MKKLGLIVVGSAAIVLSACKKDDVKTIKQVEKEMIVGTWIITEFNDSGVDETSNFSGYQFTFNEDGSLVASNGTSSLNGTWSVTDSNSNDDSSDDVDFNIYFNTTNDFQDLTDDWDIVSHSDSKIELIDVSGGNGGTDLLTFQKQ